MTPVAVSSGNLTDSAMLVNGNNQFAFDLYQALRSSDGNLFYSPYSISLALAMTYGGARGSTEKQMADTLKFNLPQERLHTTFKEIAQSIADREKGYTNYGGFHLQIANDTWAQQGFTFLPAYLVLLNQNYGAAPRSIDFAGNQEQARQTINQQVAQETEDKIKDLLPPGFITDLTRMVLTNAIYFKADWQYQFDKSDTQNSDFFLLGGNKISIQMMKRRLPVGYMKGDGYQAVELPYIPSSFSMLIILPDEGQFGVFETKLSGQMLNDIVSAGHMKWTAVDLSMPKFTYKSSFGLIKTLKTLGISDAFSPDIADFSGMDGKKDLNISDVVHQAFVAVDENGTEAAAATGAGMVLQSGPSETATMTVNRPFIFVIRDIKTGTVLFVGRVLNPSQQ